MLQDSLSCLPTPLLWRGLRPCRQPRYGLWPCQGARRLGSSPVAARPPRRAETSRQILSVFIRVYPCYSPDIGIMLRCSIRDSHQFVKVKEQEKGSGTGGGCNGIDGCCKLAAVAGRGILESHPGAPGGRNGKRHPRMCVAWPRSRRQSPASKETGLCSPTDGPPPVPSPRATGKPDFDWARPRPAAMIKMQRRTGNRHGSRRVACSHT